jgi:hypothetical protein
MACGSCGGRKRADQEWLITYKHDGSTERVGTLGEARLKLAQSPQGGSKALVSKAK